MDVGSPTDCVMSAKVIRCEGGRVGHLSKKSERKVISDRQRTIPHNDSDDPVLHSYRALTPISEDDPFRKTDLLRIKVYDDDVSGPEFILAVEIELKKLDHGNVIEEEARIGDRVVTLKFRRLFVPAVSDEARAKYDEDALFHPKIEGVEYPVIPKRKEVFVVRHGESQWNIAESNKDVVALLNSRDPGLTIKGMKQALTLNEYLRNCLSVSNSASDETQSQVQEHKEIEVQDLKEEEKQVEVVQAVETSEPAEKPATEEQVEVARATESKAIDEPVAESSASEKQAAEEPVPDAIATEATVSDSPAVEVPASEVPADGAVESDQPSETPAAETPAAEKPEAETPATEESAPVVEVPAEKVSAAESPAEEAPSAEAPAAETSAAETPVAEESAPAEEVPATNTPVAETPALEETKQIESPESANEVVKETSNEGVKPLETNSNSREGFVVRLITDYDRVPESQTTSIADYQTQEQRQRYLAELFFKSTGAFASPLCRAIQTAMLVLHDMPVLEKNHIRLMTTIRERKNITGIDTLASESEEKMFENIKAKLEEIEQEWKKAKEKSGETGDSNAEADADAESVLQVARKAFNMPIDRGDAVGGWWSSVRDTDALVIERAYDMLCTARYSGASYPVFVGHSLFFKTLCGWAVSKDLNAGVTQGTDIPTIDQMKDRRLNNGAMLYLDVHFFEENSKSPAKHTIKFATLVGPSSFHPKH